TSFDIDITPGPGGAAALAWTVETVEAGGAAATAAGYGGAGVVMMAAGDPSKGGRAAKADAEAKTLERLRDRYPDRQFSESPNPAVDYIDDLGQTYDQMGNPRAVRFWDEQRPKFLSQIDRHLAK